MPDAVTDDPSHAVLDAVPPTAFLIGAPTASGKSAVALELAERFGMEIVSADAMQVYRGLDVGTAKPSPADRARVPHHGIDLVDSDQPFSVADWVAVAVDAIEDAHARNVPCLVVGGTGFYLQALDRGLPTTPPADRRVQAEIEARLDRLGVEALETELAAASPEDARRAERNPRRLVRALEILQRTGRPPSAFPFRRPRLRIDRTWLVPSLAELEPRIRARTKAMLERGWVEEAAALDPVALATASQAIGYREAAAVAQGGLSLDEAFDAIVLATRQYARRQRTWFRKHPAERRLPHLASDARDELVAWLDVALRRG